MTDIDKMCTESFKSQELQVFETEGQLEYKKFKDLQDRASRREYIQAIQDTLESVEGAVRGDTDLCPVEHSFADGIYVRTITMPAGVLCTGRIHKHSHPNFLMKGKVTVLTEEGEKTITAPCAMISGAGTKRVVYVHEDAVWSTVHATTKTDPDDIVKDITIPEGEQIKISNIQDKIIGGE